MTKRMTKAEYFSLGGRALTEADLGTDDYAIGVHFRLLGRQYRENRFDPDPEVLVVAGRRRAGKSLAVGEIAYRVRRRGVEVYHTGTLAFGTQVDLGRLLVMADQVKPASLVVVNDNHPCFYRPVSPPGLLDAAVATWRERGVQLVVESYDLNRLMVADPAVVFVERRSVPTDAEFPDWCYIQTRWSSGEKLAVVEHDPRDIFLASLLTIDAPIDIASPSLSELEELYQSYRAYRGGRGIAGAGGWDLRQNHDNRPAGAPAGAPAQIGGPSREAAGRAESGTKAWDSQSLSHRPPGRGPAR